MIQRFISIVLFLGALACAPSIGTTTPVSVPKSAQLGCYAISVSSADFGNERIYPRPPEGVELLSEWTAGVRSGYRARVPGTAGPPQGIVATWIPEQNGRIRLYWGKEFSGLEFHLTPSRDGFSGTIETVADLEQPVIKAKADLRRNGCPP